MKILRTAAIALIGISLSSPSAHACELDFSFFTWVYQIMHPQPDCDHHDNNRGVGRDCNHGGSGGGSNSGGGGTTTPTPPISPKS